MSEPFRKPRTPETLPESIWADCPDCERVGPHGVVPCDRHAPAIAAWDALNSEGT